MNERFTPEQIEMLLGGYATGTLTPEENKALMEAALHNQQLFDALMDEEALRETLADGDTRAALLAALRPAEKARAWWQAPWPWAAAATAVVALLVLMVVRKPAPTTELAQRPAEQKVQEIAQNLPKPEPVASAVTTPKTLTATPEARSVSDRMEKTDKQDLADSKDGSRLQQAPPAEPARAAQPQKELAERDEAGAFARASGAVAPKAASPPAMAVLPDSTRQNAPRQFAAPVAPLPPAVRALEAKKATDETVRVGSAAESVTVEAVTVQPETIIQKTELAKAKAAVEPLQLALAFLQPDGTWHDLAAGAAAPSGRGLRLTVTSERSGTISMSPPLAPPRAIQAGTPLALYLPPREKGEVALVVRVGDAQPAPSQMSASRADSSSNESRLRGKRRAGALTPPPPPPAPAAVSNGLVLGGQAAGAPGAGGPLVRSIILKIE
jgi:hypothetical protein